MVCKSPINIAPRLQTKKITGVRDQKSIQLGSVDEESLDSDITSGDDLSIKMKSPAAAETRAKNNK